MKLGSDKMRSDITETNDNLKSIFVLLKQDGCNVEKDGGINR